MNVGVGSATSTAGAARVGLGVGSAVRVGAEVAAAEATKVGAEVGKAVGVEEQAGRFERMKIARSMETNFERGIIDFPPDMMMLLL